MIKLYNNSCLEVMRGIEDKSVDLVLTDPPYLMDFKGGRGKKSFGVIKNDCDCEENRQLIRDYFKECERIMKDDTVIYSFCDFRRVDFFMHEFKKHFELKNMIIWNKNNHTTGDWTCGYAFKYEIILFGIKGNKKPLNKGFTRDVIDCKKVNSKNQLHSNQKPLELLQIFIENSSKEGDVVFDGFMGSGSTGVACKELNRSFIGCELLDKYYNIAKERLDYYEEDDNVEVNITTEDYVMMDNFKKHMDELSNKGKPKNSTIKEEIFDNTYVWVDLDSEGSIIGEVQCDEYDVNIHFSPLMYNTYKDEAIEKLLNKVNIKKVSY